MTEMCINTDDEMIPGQTGVGHVWNANFEPITVAMRVIEEITIDVYLAFVEEHKLTHMVHRNIRDQNLRFFRIEILD